jgi:hypothetical protein
MTVIRRICIRLNRPRDEDRGAASERCVLSGVLLQNQECLSGILTRTEGNVCIPDF